MMDPEFVRCQYSEAGRLNTRIDLHLRYSINRQGWHPWVWEQLDLPPQADILELGGGRGDLWLQNAARWPVGWRLAFTDLYPRMVRDARQGLKATKRQACCLTTDACALPFPSGSFDAVIANHMLYHVADRSRAFAEIHRVLRPGGRLFAATNGRGHLGELQRLVLRMAPRSGYRVGVPGFTLENGAEQLRPYFREVEVRRFPDALLITDPEPLADYVLSALDSANVERQALTEFLAREIGAAGGAVRIEKDPGLFVASRDK